MALSLMPYDTVLAGYDEIRDHAQDLPNSPMERLFTYFENQWLVDIDMWNVSKTEIRTNNCCEGTSRKGFVLMITTTYCHCRLSQPHEPSNSAES
jgi:hypothetical protein